jgi:hypothetical protein
MRWLLLAAVALCSGCVPVVQHGPWVRPGLSGSLSGGAGAGVNVDGGAGPFFTFDGSMRASVQTNDSLHTGVSLGVQLPLMALLAFGEEDSSDEPFAFLHLLHLDGYVTGPVVNGIHTAAGLTVSEFHVMPYVQAGRYDRDYVSFAAMFMRESDVVIAAPSYTWLRRIGDQTLSAITLTAGMGRGEGETVFLGGLTIGFEFHGKNARP